jgi:hypothetical protein
MLQTRLLDRRRRSRLRLRRRSPRLRERERRRFGELRRRFSEWLRLRDRERRRRSRLRLRLRWRRRSPDGGAAAAAPRSPSLPISPALGGAAARRTPTLQSARSTRSCLAARRQEEARVRVRVVRLYRRAHLVALPAC